MGLQYLNSMYVDAQYGSNDNNNGRRQVIQKDFLMVTIKDTETGETKLKFIEEPEVEFYTSISPQKFPSVYMPRDRLIQHKVKYHDRRKAIADALGLTKQFYEAISNKTLWLFVKDMMNHPDLYMGDVDIEDYSKTMFTRRHGAHFGKYKKAFSDIEVDISNYKGFPYPETAPCVINMINHFDLHTNSFYSVVLDDPTIPAIKEIRADQEGYIRKNLLPELDGADYKYYFIWCKNEREVIANYFKVVHDTKPDYCGFWNMRFDMLTILNRMKKLNMKPTDYMCHPEVPQNFRYVRYIVDEQKPSFGAKDDDDDEVGSANNKGNKHPSRLWDWPMISGYTQWYDQMSLYSNMRKRSLLPSYKLDNIGQDECGVNKVNFRKMGYTMNDIIHKNFPLFLAYAIKDTYVQKKIEEKVEDIDKYVLFSGTTRFHKGTKISYVIKNLLMNSFLNDDLIIGNTIEYNIREKAPGAIVSRPELMLKKGMVINGIESNVYEFVIDFDAASQYPNLMIALNIAKNTIVNCIYDVVSKRKGANDDNEFHVSNGEAFNTALQTIETSLFDIGTEYFGLPSITDIMSEIESAL